MYNNLNQAPSTSEKSPRTPEQVKAEIEALKPNLLKLQSDLKAFKVEHRIDNVDDIDAIPGIDNIEKTKIGTKLNAMERLLDEMSDEHSTLSAELMGLELDAKNKAIEEGQSVGYDQFSLDNNSQANKLDAAKAKEAELLQKLDNGEI
jgi:hypothetical protein